MTRTPRSGGRLPAALIVLLAALSPGAAGAVTIFGLVDTGELYASADGGASWSIRSALPARDAVALAADSTSSSLLLCTASGILYRSADAGMSWSAVASIPASDIRAMVSRPGRILLISESGSVFSSPDRGATFAAVGAIPASDLVSAAWQGSYFAVTRAGEVYRSSDQGATWAAVSALDGAGAVAIVAFGSRLYVLSAAGDVAMSSLDGTSWSFVSTLSQSGMSALAVAKGELLATTVSGETAASATGAHWAWRGAIGQLSVRALGTDAPTTVGVPAPAPGPFDFAPPWPNPARSQVTLAFELDAPAAVTVEVFDLGGRLVARPIDGDLLPAGRITRAWRPSQLSPGRYVLRAQVGDRRRIRSFAWLGTR